MSLELAAVGNRNLLGGLAGLRTHSLDSLDHVQALNNLAEDDVLAVQPRAGDRADEELGTVGVRASVSHRQDTGTSVLVDEVLISELSTIDGLTTDARAVSEITSLEHELGDNSVENRVLEVQRLSTLSHSLLSSAKSSEVLGSLGDAIGVQFHDDSSSGLITDGHVEENLGVRHVFYKMIN